MASQVRFAHDRRRVIVDTPPETRASLRIARRHDDLDPVRGVVYGSLLGIALWAVIILAWFIWS